MERFNRRELLSSLSTIFKKHPDVPAEKNAASSANEPKKFTRRKVLICGGAVIASGAIGATINKFGVKPEESPDFSITGEDIFSPEQSIEQQNSVATELTEPETTTEITVAEETLPAPESNVFKAVFDDLPPDKKEDARQKVDEMKTRLNQTLGQNAFAVTAKWEDTIRENANRVGFPEELALGIVFIENGGGDDKINPASGARGVAQLMPETAKRYGLTVNSQVDERRNPVRNIKAMAEYLKDSEARFGNPGLATWTYHAGEGNVYRAIETYAKNETGVDPGNILASPNYETTKAIERNYSRFLEETKPNVHEILSDPQVQRNVLANLGDETHLYTYKAVAAADIFKEKKDPPNPRG